MWSSNEWLPLYLKAVIKFSFGCDVDFPQAGQRLVVSSMHCPRRSDVFFSMDGSRMEAMLINTQPGPKWSHFKFLAL